MSKQKTVAELQKQITRLTGKEPQSDDPVYLTQRIAQLKRKADAGVDIKPKRGTAPITASMPIDARKAFDRIVEKEKIGTSALVVKALAFWAAANGYEAEAATMGAE